MSKIINLNWNDLCKETQDYIFDKAIASVVNEEGDDICEDYECVTGDKEFDSIVRQKAEHKLYEFEYKFNM